jgi:C1A family cysteine protease
MDTRLSESNSFPSSYDLRSLGKVSLVRDQNSYGTCWALASFGSLESALLTTESWDFSEDNLVNMSGFDLDPYFGGGNQDMATAYLTRWSGPVREDQDPYPTPGALTLPSEKHVQEVLYLPGRSGPLDNSYIKNALMTYGGVYTTIYWSSSYYNSTCRSYFYSGTKAPNHAVVIVGWDDDYPASNFSSRPPGNGAFIVRNSWGSSWGEGGFFTSLTMIPKSGEILLFSTTRSPFPITPEFTSTTL